MITFELIWIRLRLPTISDRSSGGRPPPPVQFNLLFHSDRTKLMKRRRRSNHQMLKSGHVRGDEVMKEFTLFWSNTAVMVMMKTNVKSIWEGPKR